MLPNERINYNLRRVLWDSMTNAIGRFYLGASSLPFMPKHVPLATYFQSVGSMSFFAWPAQLWDPFEEAQSFAPAFAIPKHFSLGVVLAAPAAMPGRLMASAIAARAILF